MRSPPTPTRRPDRSGRDGEAVAAEWLRRRGHRVAARNLRTVHGEIDLLVRRRRTWIAVEVKARADHPAPERHVDADKLDRLARALVALAPTLRPAPRALRIDAVAIRWQGDGSAEVRHFAGLRAYVEAPRGTAASATERWRPAPRPVYSCAADEVGSRRWRAGLRRLVRWLVGPFVP